MSTAKLEPVVQSTEPSSNGAPTDLPTEPVTSTGSADPAPAAPQPHEHTEADGQADDEAEAEAQRELKPITIHLPLPSHARTLPVSSGPGAGGKGKRDPREQYTTLQLYPQPGETVQELKLAVGEWVGGYWFGPYSLRRRVASGTGTNGGDDVKSNGNGNGKKEPRLSEWMEVADVWGGASSESEAQAEEEDKQLEVVFDAYTPASARQTILRLLDLLSPSSPSPISALTQPAGLVPSPALFPLVASGSSLSSLPSLASATSHQVEITVPAPARKGRKHAPASVTVRRDLKPEETHAFADWTDGVEWVAEDLGRLPLAFVPEKEDRCLREVQLSPWNPVRPEWKARGHLVYLQVTTLENEQVTLVCTSGGWYASKITADKFDPTPASVAGKPVHSLIDLLHALSPGFCTKFAQLPHLAGLAQNNATANGSAEPKAPADPLVTVAVPQAHPVYPWLVPTSLSSSASPGPDPVRTQLAYLHTGSTSADGLDSSRDWNEDLQAVRELPRGSMPERTARERMAAKIGFEFELAAVRAVLAVSRGEVPPLNPLEPVGSHMYLHSNIFITRALDSISAYAHLGGDEAAHVFHGKDAEGVRLLNKLDQEGVWTLGHTVVDWKGERWVGQSVLPGIFSRRGDEAPAGGVAIAAADEGKKEDGWVDVSSSGGDSPSKPTAESADQADVNGDATATTAAPSSEPEPENPLIIHGIDSEHAQYIHYDPASAVVLAKLGEALHLATHTVTDGKGKEHEFVTSAEVKALRGTDGRRYLLDLPRLNPVDVEWLEKDTGADAGAELGAYPHRVTLLRPELVASFWETELKVWARATAKQQKEEADVAKTNGADADEKAADDTKADAAEDDGEIRIPAEKARSFALALNPDAFVDQPLPRPAGVDPLAAGSTWAAPVGEYVPSTMTDALLPEDKAVGAVRAASAYLRETVIPALVVDVMSGGVTGVMDGWSLGRVLKSRGVNMRYLGRVAQQADKFGSKGEGADGAEEQEQGEAQGHLGSFKRVVKTEITFRALKHVLRRLLAPLHIDQSPAAIAHFLNCLLGSELNPAPKAEYTPVPFAEDDAEPAYVSLTPEGLRQMVAEEAGRRFRYRLEEGWLPGSTSVASKEEEGVRKESLLRELATRVGFQLVQRSYAFSASDVSTPVANGVQSNGVANGHGETSPERKDKDKKKTPKANGHSAAPRDAHSRSTTFLPTDVLTLTPLVKGTTPSSSVADEIRALALSTLARGQAHLALDFLLESIQILENVHAVVHPDVAAGYNHYASTVQQLARLKIQQVAARQAERAERAEKRARAAADKADKALTEGKGGEIDLDDKGAEEEKDEEALDADQPLGYDTAHALRMQRQACVIAERTLGVWHAETAQYYLNLAMLENLAGEPGMALRYFRHCLRIWEVVYGQGNGEVVQVLSNAGIVLQSLAPSPLAPTPSAVAGDHPTLPGADKISLHLLQLSAALTRRIFGPASLSLGHALHQLTQARFLSMDIPGAVGAAEEARDIFQRRLGPGAALTKEAERNLELLNRVKGVREGAERQMREMQEEGAGLALPSSQAQMPGSPANALNGGNGDGARPRVPLGGGLRGMRERLLANQMANGAPGPSRLSGVSAPGQAQGQADPRIGEKGHLELDELVRFIQGGTRPAVQAVGAGAGKGKRRTGRR